MKTGYVEKHCQYYSILQDQSIYLRRLWKTIQDPDEVQTISCNSIQSVDEEILITIPSKRKFSTTKGLYHYVWNTCYYY
jgi:hypothetical protein